jgi:hypothetical protein
MEKKKKLLPILIIIILILVLFTGCTGQREFPVQTQKPDVSWDFERVQLIGFIAVPFCKACNHRFVYDIESHENWEDYQFTETVDGLSPYESRFNAGISTRDLEHKIMYYVRAVAYCYDFIGRFKDYEEGYYSGSEKTFYIDW